MTAAGNDLSEAEAKLWRAAQTGDVVDLRSGDPELDRPARGWEWDAGRTVRAAVLSRLLVGGADVPPAAPKGVRLQGALISGQLDLELATLRCLLALLDCLIEEVVILDEANAPTVRLAGSHLPGLQARQLVTRGDLRLDAGFTAAGGVVLAGAHIGGQLICDGGAFTNDNGPALIADGLTVDGGGAAARRPHRRTVRLRRWRLHQRQRPRPLRRRAHRRGGHVLSRGVLGEHIGGQLTCTHGTFTNENGCALHLGEATISGPLYLLPTTFSGSSIDLTDAQVRNYVDDRRTWPQALLLDGFTYSSIEATPEITNKERLEWLTRNASGFSP
jgi:hypothetical protein